MSWTPPTLTTVRLLLACPPDVVQPVFLQDGQSAPARDLPGLPSNWRIHLDGCPIGIVGFIRWERNTGLGEIGFSLTRSFRGQGYMTEACRAVIAFGFSAMGLGVVEAKSLPNNLASVRVLARIGMTQVARVQGRLSSQGALVDLDIYQIRRPVSQEGTDDRTAPLLV